MSLSLAGTPFKMSEAAQAWAAEALPLSLTANDLPNRRKEAGKSWMWTAVFVSRSTRAARAYTYATVDEESFVRKGVGDRSPIGVALANGDNGPPAVSFAETRTQSRAGHEPHMAVQDSEAVKRPGLNVLTATLANLSEEEAKTAAEKVDRLMQRYRARGLAIVGPQETLEAWPRRIG
jgi:hypothetical protein